MTWYCGVCVDCGCAQQGRNCNETDEPHQRTLPEVAVIVQRAKRTVRQSPEVDGTLAEAYTRLSMLRSAEAIYEEMLSYLPGAEKLRVEKLLAGVRKKSRKEKSS